MGGWPLSFDSRGRLSGTASFLTISSGLDDLALSVFRMYELRKLRTPVCGTAILMLN